MVDKKSPQYFGDTLTPAERSERMRRVKGKDTKPELFVRRLVFAMGYRYRVHLRLIPGKPDIAFPNRKKAIFVHGCFWHRHIGCPNNRLPKSRLDFWLPKLDGNRRRDKKKQRELRESGWSYLVIWECETQKKNLESRIRQFLTP